MVFCRVITEEESSKVQVLRQEHYQMPLERILLLQKLLETFHFRSRKKLALIRSPSRSGKLLKGTHLLAPSNILRRL